MTASKTQRNTGDRQEWIDFRVSECTVIEPVGGLRQKQINFMILSISWSNVPEEKNILSIYL